MRAAAQLLTLAGRRKRSIGEILAWRSAAGFSDSTHGMDAHACAVESSRQPQRKDTNGRAVDARDVDSRTDMPLINTINGTGANATRCGSVNPSAETVLHAWDGCRCAVCGRQNPDSASHDLKGCRCTKCGVLNPNPAGHDLQGSCWCKRCRQSVHCFDVNSCRCTKCKAHRFIAPGTTCEHCAEYFPLVEPVEPIDTSNWYR